MKLFRAIGNTQGDDFGVFDDDEQKVYRVMSQQDWIDKFNSWQEADGNDYRYTLDDWDNLDDWDRRGVILEEVKLANKWARM